MYINDERAINEGIACPFCRTPVAEWVLYGRKIAFGVNFTHVSFETPEQEFNNHVSRLRGLADVNSDTDDEDEKEKLNNQIKCMREELCQTTKTRDMLVNLYYELTEKLDEKDTELKNVKAEKNKLCDKLEDALRFISSYDLLINLHNLQQEKDNLKQSVNELETCLNTKNAEIKKLLEELNTKNAELVKLFETKDKLSHINDGLYTMFKNKTTELENTKTELENTKTELKNLRDIINDPKNAREAETARRINELKMELKKYKSEAEKRKHVAEPTIKKLKSKKQYHCILKLPHACNAPTCAQYRK